MGSRSSSSDTACADKLADELESHYNEIFPTGNRNAASHKWVFYIIKNMAPKLQSVEQVEALFTGFCPVSGSPVSPSSRSKYFYKEGYLMPAEDSAGKKQSGVVFHCCWPCFCDTANFIRTDPVKIPYGSGKVWETTALVIKDPCRSGLVFCVSR